MDIVDICIIAMMANTIMKFLQILAEIKKANEVEIQIKKNK